MITLKNKIVFITGASSGIGKACAYAFARENANLVIIARREEYLKEIAADIEKQYPVKVYSEKLDIRDYSHVKEVIKQLPDEWKKIDILINNAGIGRGLNKFYEDDPTGWEEMIDTNIKGTLYITKEIIPGMVERKSGHIINIGSIAGHEGYSRGSVYCATKQALQVFTRALQIDVLDKNIRVSSIDPGITKTEFFNVRFYGDSHKEKEYFKGLIPLNADDVAEAVIFAATRPLHVNINQMIILPRIQANSQIVHRHE